MEGNIPQLTAQRSCIRRMPRALATGQGEKRLHFWALISTHFFWGELKNQQNKVRFIHITICLERKSYDSIKSKENPPARPTASPSPVQLPAASRISCPGPAASALCTNSFSFTQVKYKRSFSSPAVSLVMFIKLLLLWI